MLASRNQSMEETGGSSPRKPSATTNLSAPQGDADLVRDMAVIEELQASLGNRHLELMQRLDQQDAILAQLLLSRPALRPAAAAVPSVTMEDVDAEPATPKSVPGTRLRSVELEDAEKREAAKEMSSATQELDTHRDDNNDVGRYKTMAKIVVFSIQFEIFFAMCIFTNAIVIGVEAQYTYEKPGPHPMPFLVIGQLYTFAFTLELILRIFASGRDFFTSGEWMWNCFDIFIVGTALIEVVIEVVYATNPGLQSEAGFPASTALRVMRIIRITRLVKVMQVSKVMKFIRALRTLVQAIAMTLRSLVWAMVLLLLLVYVFGIIFTQAVGDALNSSNSYLSDDARHKCETYWDGLHVSMLSLFMAISGGVSWELLIAPLHEISVLWTWVFIFYISFAYFAVLNVVTGVFCQSAIDSAQSDHELMMLSIVQNKAAHLEKIKGLFHEIAGGDRTYITFQEFEEHAKDAKVQTYFESLELDVNDAWDFFKLLDQDGGAAIEIEEFLMGCLRLRGEARALDTAKLLHSQTSMAKKQAEFMHFVEDAFRSIGDALGKKIV